MRFSEYLIEGVSRTDFNAEEIKALQQLAQKHDRDFDHHGPTIEIGPEPYEQQNQTHTDISKELSRKSPGKMVYHIEETVSTQGEDADEYPGNSFTATDFEMLLNKLQELLD